LFARLGRKKSLDGLDKTLFRGLSRPVQAKDVIEFYGKSGSGKTQILFHLIANCILPQDWNGASLGGRGVGVIFVDTDYHFSLVRLVEILEERIKSCFLHQGLPMTSTADLQTFVKSCLSRLIVAKCDSTAELLDTMRSFDKTLCYRTDIRLMMIDSVSAFYWRGRGDGDENYQGREKHQKKLIELLERYINQHHLVVVATLQAIFPKRCRRIQYIQRMEDYAYMCQPWKWFVKCAYVVSRSSNESSTFLLKQIKPYARNFVINFSVDKGGLSF
jgi:DNA-repair protein XRCC2